MPPARFLLHPNAWMPAAHTAQRGARTQTPGGGTTDTEPAGGPCSAFQVRRGARVVQAFLSLFSTGPLPCLPRAPVAKNHAPNCSEESKEGASFWSVTEQKSIPNLDSSQHYDSGKFRYLKPIHKKKVGPLEKMTPWIRAVATPPEVPSLIFSTQVAADNHL